MSEEGGHDDDEEHQLLVRVEDDDGEKLYIQGADCEFCGREATGVLVAEHPRGGKISKAVCESDHARIEQENNSLDYEFRPLQ